MIEPSKLQGIYEDKKKKAYYTLNLVPGVHVYDEKLVSEDGQEYREWNPRKSKLAAALMKEVSQIGIKPGSIVLYLGCSTGTTISHVSDIVGKSGFVFGVDIGPRVMREMVFVCEERTNIAPILANARDTQLLGQRICQPDIVYQDLAQKDQVEIFLKNCSMFLKKGGFGLLFVKARSIDVTKSPRLIYADIRKKLEQNIMIVDYRELDPLEKDHCVFVCKKQ